MDNWINNAIALVSGGLIWEGIKLAQPDIRRFLENYYKAKKNIYENLDPILKSSDELYGKIFSLSKEDFSTFTNEQNSNSEDVNQNKIYIYYLFSQFWAQLEIIRNKSQYYSISRVKKGKHLLRFIETFESREFRILDRSLQRIIGETLIEEAGDTFKVMSLNSFSNKYKNSNSNLYKHISILESKLNNTTDKEIRQKFLMFGVIVACLIDHFDKEHKIVRRREIFLNKLSKKSLNKIRRSLLGHYLIFIKKKSTYYK